MRDKDYLMDELFDEDEEWPEWYDGKHINEALFCQYFLQLHPMKCIHGRLFTVDGMVEDEGEISQMILDEIQGSVTKGLAKTVSGLLSDPLHQGAENADAHRQRRRGQEPHWFGDALHTG